MSSETTTFDWVWSQLYLLCNHIAGFFGHQYPWKESSDILVFLSSRQSLANCIFCPITLEEFLSSISARRNTTISYCLHADSHQGKVAPETTFFGWVYWLYLLSNQITGFFDHQYLWKTSCNMLDFLHKDSHQAKVACGTTSFG